ncbi:hypothetical protein JZ751_008636 [Albula glossodonta]|uniref:Ellis-van Creveld syndrome protein n=1 Tax=Albula glossodonta TaxID=121402 RepID=A0A8T2P7A0_9TELE|nr:hypothetical protein JZ751_008636 [Albula glossodonta]
MPNVDSIPECSSDVVIEFAESLQLFPGLLAVAIVFGVFFGIVAATLLYVFFLKPVLLNRKFQGYDARKLFETDDLDKEDNHSDSVSVGKKAGQNMALNERFNKEKKQLPASSDVAAFALKAKPLADGASNPSLHENSRLAMLPNAESSSSSSLESLSQDNEEDSSQCVTSSPIPNTFQNERFIRVGCFPETLTFEGRISLYCVGLQSFQHLCSELQEERQVILKILFDELFRKEKTDSAFYSNILLMQEREMGFSRQVERLCQHLHSRPGLFSKEVEGQTTHTLIHSLLQVENQLAEFQFAEMKAAQEKLLSWEELRAWLQALPALLKQEAVCRLRLVAKALEQLTSDGQLSFTHMERMLSELQSAIREELQHCTEECTRQTKELVNEMYKKTDSKRRKLVKSQAKERGRALDTTQQLRDPLEFVKRVHSSWSEKLADRVKDLFLTTLPGQTHLSAQRCEQLRQEADRDLCAQLQREEALAKQSLQGLQEQLDLDRQVWVEEDALVTASLRHLCEQQLKILRGMSVKQKDWKESGAKSLMEEKHRLLLTAVQRQFMSRHFTLRALKEMRLSRLKMPPLSESKAAELEDCSKTQNTLSLTPRAIHKDNGVSEAERRLGPESQLISQGFQQEFLSELDTGAELLQEHAQLLVGHALAQSVHQHSDAQPTPQQRPHNSRKLHLTEAASESVYVTRGSISALIHNYYTQIQSITKTQQEDHQHQLESIGGECDRARGRSLLNKALQKELANWERKPTSSEFYQRVEMQKKRILAQFDADLEAAYETLRRRKSDEAEETFMTRLAALARVPFTSRELGHTNSHAGEDGQGEWKRSTGASKESDVTPQRPGNLRQRYEQGYLLDFLEESEKRKKRKQVEE